MLKINKLSDYGIVLLTTLETVRQGHDMSARELAIVTRIPMPTVKKLLKSFSRAGILESRRGITGGYCLARNSKKITVAEIIESIEGPIALTECLTLNNRCDVERGCPTKTNWHKLNYAVTGALRGLTLKDMIQPTIELKTIEYVVD